MRIIRVFPRKTRATPDDQLAYVGAPDFFAEADEVHISVAFTADIPIAETLEKEWKHVASVKIGGPAFNEPGGDFTPGMYLKKGYVITSRGCPNRCWFCAVPKREGYGIRELPITEGNNLLDDNILACSEGHIRAVFKMLEKQPRVEFTGGLEAKRLKAWHVQELLKVRPKQMFFAYDTPDDLEPLIEAGKMLKEAGFKYHHLRCYVLIGYPKDDIDSARNRLQETLQAGFMPMAMLYRSERSDPDHAWKQFQRKWARPAIINSKIRAFEEEVK